MLSLEYIKKVAITVVYLKTEIKYERRDLATNTEYERISFFVTHFKIDIISSFAQKDQKLSFGTIECSQPRGRS